VPPALDPVANVYAADVSLVKSIPRATGSEYNPLPMKKNPNADSTPLAESEEGEILERLSERVEKAVATIQELRRERDQLRSRITDLEARVADSDETSERVSTLERERGEIRGRIESILGSLEALETAE
jgi:FtsZ-binding cell division protein ZapB